MRRQPAHEELEDRLLVHPAPLIAGGHRQLVAVDEKRRLRRRQQPGIAEVSAHGGKSTGVCSAGSPEVAAPRGARGARPAASRTRSRARVRAGRQPGRRSGALGASESASGGDVRPPALVFCASRWPERRGRDSNPRGGLTRPRDFQSRTLSHSVTSPSALTIAAASGPGGTAASAREAPSGPGARTRLSGFTGTLARRSKTAEQALGAIATRNHGVVTRAEALAAGLSDDQIRHRLRTGQLLREYPGGTAWATGR